MAPLEGAVEELGMIATQVKGVMDDATLSPRVSKGHPKFDLFDYTHLCMEFYSAKGGPSQPLLQIIKGLERLSLYLDPNSASVSSGMGTVVASMAKFKGQMGTYRAHWGNFGAI